MIISSDINPRNTLYYNGALLINVLNEINKVEVDFLELLAKAKEKYNISMQLFILSIDWLYLLGVIENKEGKIKKCF